MATFFTASYNFTVGGYKTVYKKYSWAPFAIKVGEGDDAVSIPPPQLPYSSDVRGVLPAGTVPSKTLSYRAYWKVVARNTLSNTSPTSEFFGNVPLFGGGLAAAASTVTPGFNIGVSYPSVAVVMFEGKDVVDLPTNTLTAEEYPRPNQTAQGENAVTQREEDGTDDTEEPVQTQASSAYFLNVPDRVYLAIHAGINKLIPEEDSKGFPYWANVAANGPLQGNLNKGFVKVTPEATFDTKIAAGASGVGRDVASNKILITDGVAQYVSYVAATKLLFKDVIKTRVSAYTFGFYFSSNELAITETAPGNIDIQSILRYSFLPPAPNDQPLEDEKEQQEDAESTLPQAGFVWRLTESIGLDLTNKFNTLPAEIEQTLDVATRSRYGSAQIQKHYAYNINEAGPDFDENNNILKAGYNPVLAEMKMDPTSPLYDSAFKANMLPLKKGTGLGSIDYQAVDVYGNSPDGQSLVGSPSPEIFYTSPMFEYSFTQKTRIGFEHYGQLLDGYGSGSLDFRLLVRAKDEVSGLSCCYDPCLTQASLFSSSTVGILERMLDDRRWTRYQVDTPTGANLPMMTGEFPFRSEGQCVLTPPEKELSAKIDTKTGVIEIKNSQAIVTSVAFKVGAIEGGGGLDIEDFEDTFKFFNTDNTDVLPSQEISLGGMALKRGQVFFNIFPTRPKVYLPGGGLRSIIQLYGVSEGDAIAAPFKAGTTNNGIDQQQSAVGTMTFPASISNITCSLDCVSGLYFVAFENENRIDMGVRQSPFEKFSLIRDVVRRIPDQVARDGKQSIAEAYNFPPATLPWLLIDVDVKNLYLFFHYKNRLFCKKIPYELYVSSSNKEKSTRYEVEEEQSISRRIMEIPSCMVLDPALFKAADKASFSDLKVDFQAKNLKVMIKEEEDPAILAEALEDDASIQQYCVGMDSAGYMYAFVQVGDRIVVSRSSSLGEEWETIIGSKSILPAPPEGLDLEEESLAAPYIMYDTAQDKFMVFFIYSLAGVNHSLIYMELPVTFLRDTPENIAAKQDQVFKPYLLWGYYDEKVQQRGIIKSKSEEVNRAVLGNPRFFTRPEEELKLLDNMPIQRIAGLISFDGYYRIFFRDDNNNIRSMISNDSGKIWIVDEARPGLNIAIEESGKLDLQSVVDGSATDFFEELDQFEYLDDAAYEEGESEDFV